MQALMLSYAVRYDCHTCHVHHDLVLRTHGSASYDMMPCICLCMHAVPYNAAGIAAEPKHTR